MEAELDSFQRQVAEKFTDLNASGDGDGELLSLEWIGKLLDSFLCCQEEFRAIVEAPEFVEAFGSVSDDGESLKRVPAGYPPDHPAADLLRKKNVTFGRRLSDDDAFSPELPRILADAFATGTPLLRFLASV